MCKIQEVKSQITGHSPPSSSLSTVAISAGGNWRNVPLLPSASGPGPHSLLKVLHGPVAPGWTLPQVGTWTGGGLGTQHVSPGHVRSIRPGCSLWLRALHSHDSSLSQRPSWSHFSRRYGFSHLREQLGFLLSSTSQSSALFDRVLALRGSASSTACFLCSYWVCLEAEDWGQDHLCPIHPWNPSTEHSLHSLQPFQILVEWVNQLFIPSKK